MTLESVACNQCGGPLAIPDAVKFVACNHCGASLAVRRHESVTYTELVEKIAEQTADLAEQVAQLRYENEMIRLDREWEQQRNQYLVKAKDGSLREPSETGSVIGGVVAIVFGIIWTLSAASMGGGLFALFGLLIVGVVLWGMLHEGKKARQYRQAYENYLDRRQSLSVARLTPSTGDDDGAR